MKVIRLYTGGDQKSHFEEKELTFEGDKIQTTRLQAAGGVVFRRAPALSGSWEIECSDGSKRLFKPGDVMLAEDLNGKGHVSRVVGNEPHIFMTVPLTE
jgi:hypothetical protein